MQTDRRQFLDSLAAGAVALGGLSLGLAAVPSEIAAAAAPRPTRAADWDTTWPSRLRGRIKTVFDVPEVESGYGVWRASIWARQYEQVLGIPAAQLSTALVIRHNAIVLAMTQPFWDRYGLAEFSKATHPLSGEATKRNPALLNAADGVGEPYVNFALPAFISRGGVALACDLALQDLVAVVQKVDGVDETVAQQRAVAGLVPGVILQPSGIFAALHAQQAAQALYIRAS